MAKQARTTKPAGSGATSTSTAPMPPRVEAQVTKATLHIPTQDEIARRAYEIFKSRNGRPGDPVADWLQAERELSLSRTLR